MDSLLSMSVFLDDHALFDHTLKHFLRGRAIAASPNMFIFPASARETTRDSAIPSSGWVI